MTVGCTDEFGLSGHACYYLKKSKLYIANPSLQVEKYLYRPLRLS